jgi:hypothetical protein
MSINIDMTNCEINNGPNHPEGCVLINGLYYRPIPGEALQFIGNSDGTMTVKGAQEVIPEFPPAKTQIATVIDMHSWKKGGK